MACAKEYGNADVGYRQGETISQRSVVRKGIRKLVNCEDTSQNSTWCIASFFFFLISSMTGMVLHCSHCISQDEGAGEGFPRTQIALLLQALAQQSFYQIIR